MSRTSKGLDGALVEAAEWDAGRDDDDAAAVVVVVVIDGNGDDDGDGDGDTADAADDDAATVRLLSESCGLESARCLCIDTQEVGARLLA